ncbi:hypothetical protein SLE2022_315470 [Rubroshorea leprosula]
MNSNRSSLKIVKFQDLQKNCQDDDIPSPARWSREKALAARWSQGTKPHIRHRQEIAHPSVEEGKEEKEK